MASLMEGEIGYEAAQKQKNLSAESLVNMLLIVGKYLKDNGETAKATAQFKFALKVMDAFEEDFVENRWFKSTIYDLQQRDEIEGLLRDC